MERSEVANFYPLWAKTLLDLGRNEGEVNKIQYSFLKILKKSNEKGQHRICNLD